MLCKNHENITAWHSCKSCRRDIIMILLMAFLVYTFNPIDHAYKIVRIVDDWGALTNLVILAIIAIESSFLCLKHYWLWIYLSPFIILVASWHDGHLDAYFINGLIFLFPIIPIAELIYYFRKNNIKEMLQSIKQQRS